MSVHQLIGQKIYIQGSELFSPAKNAKILAIDTSTKSLLLELVPPIRIDTQNYSFAVATPRLQCDDFDVLLMNGILGCAVTCVPRSRYDETRPFDLSWWRGGAAVVADLVLQG